MTFGVASMTAPLRRVALRAPGDALLSADPTKWHYGDRFDAHRVQQEHAAFADHLVNQNIDVLWMHGDDEGIADAVFTYDASLMTPAGAILMNPGKHLRRGEENLHADFYRENAIAIIGEISGEARCEAGDTLWLDENTLAVGIGQRTNFAGFQKLKSILEPIGISARSFELPPYGEEEACLHLMSLISLVDEGTALICAELLPNDLRTQMEVMGYRFIEAPMHEFEESGTLSLNVLALAPGKCVMIDGEPETTGLLKNAGIDVHLINAPALCIGCEGGPTCLTRPILRAA